MPHPPTHVELLEASQSSSLYPTVRPRPPARPKRRKQATQHGHWTRSHGNPASFAVQITPFANDCRRRLVAGTRSQPATGRRGPAAPPNARNGGHPARCWRLARADRSLHGAVFSLVFPWRGTAPRCHWPANECGRTEAQDISARGLKRDHCGPLPRVDTTCSAAKWREHACSVCLDGRCAARHIRAALG